MLSSVSWFTKSEPEILKKSKATPYTIIERMNSHTPLPGLPSPKKPKKRTNPTAEKIMIICNVLNVTPEWLLSGVEVSGTRSNPIVWYAVDSNTEVGCLVETYNACDSRGQARLLAYALGLKDMMDEKKEADERTKKANVSVGLRRKNSSQLY